MARLAPLGCALLRCRQRARRETEPVSASQTEPPSQPAWAAPTERMFEAWRGIRQGERGRDEEKRFERAAGRSERSERRSRIARGESQASFGACPSPPRTRAPGACGGQSRSEEEAMRCHRRRRATPSAPATPRRPQGSGGVGPSAALPLLADGPASAASRRLAAGPTAPGTQVRGGLGQAPSRIANAEPTKRGGAAPGSSDFSGATGPGGSARAHPGARPADQPPWRGLR